MDPLSVTASIVTLITVAGSIIQHLDRMRSRMDPQAELIAILNTLTDLQTTLTVVRDEDDALRSSRTPAARLAYNTLPETIGKLETYLDQLTKLAHANLLRNGKGLSRLGLSTRRKKELADIREKILDAHRNLQLVLLSVNLRRNRELLSRIEEVAIVHSKNHAETSVSLNRISDQLKSVSIHEENDLETYQCPQENIRSILVQSVYDNSNEPSTQLRITTNLPTKACEWICNCQCHVRTQYQTPQWLSATIGTLFYSSTSTPSLDVRPCNVPYCLRSHPSSSSRVTYYFPTWMLRTALVFSTWSNLKGKNSSWVVKVPREIPYNDPVWNYVLQGDVDAIKGLLENREISPYDIAPDGSSILHWARNDWQLEICSLLTTMGADWNFKDRSGRSASDTAWIEILLNRRYNAGVVKLRDLVGPEDSYDLHLSPLHRIIGGLSAVDLESQINLDPSRIEDRDWLGATPLMWASRIGNSAHVNIMLSRGAKTEARDSVGQTALHYAVEGGSLRCIKALLEAGADAQAVGDHSLTPLHYVLYFTDNCEVEDIISCLCAHGADLEARDSLGYTPLHFAVELGSHMSAEAFIRCGAGVNSLGRNNDPPIERAILNGFEDIVKLLFQAGTMVSWIDCYGNERDVISDAILCGTVRVMDAISRSDIAPVKCNVTQSQLWHWFEERQDKNLVEYSPAQKRAAFERLLEKAVLLDSDVVDSLVDVEDE